MVSNRQPWLVEGSPWKTESAFWTWVRGVLRKGWSKHPVKILYIQKYRKRITNPVEKNRKRFPECWGMTCEICKKDVAQKDIEIDHIGDSHSFTGLHDVVDYVSHLYLIDFESIRALCKPCHKIVTHSQNKGISFEEAATEKEIIRLMKKDNKDELLAILESFGYNVKNDKQRKQALREIFQKEK